MNHHPVTTDGTVSCAHKGKATPSGTSKLVVDGHPVVPYASAATLTGYAEKCTYSDASGPKPCTTTVPASTREGRATKLLVSGAPVLLDSLEATTAPAGTGVSVAAGQSRLRAV